MSVLTEDRLRFWHRLRRQFGVSTPVDTLRIMGSMFIVAWEGGPPPDKTEWIRDLREVLAAELGSYRILFRRHGGGWRFELEWREEEQERLEELVANTPESVVYNVYVNLVNSGKPIDPTWRPGGAG
jgi:hypothetical protein